MRRVLIALGRTVPLCAALAACGGTSAPAGSAPLAYAAFATARAVAITGYSGDAMEPFISRDGQFLFFNNRNDPSVDTDLFHAARVDDLTFAFRGPVAGANSGSLDAVASLDAQGGLFFVTTRSYASTLSTVYSASWSALGGAVGVAAVGGVSLQRPGMVNFDAEISADGQTLWFDDGQFSASGELQAASLVVATRQGAAFVRRADSAALLAAVNATGLNYAPSVSADGLELFFTRLDSTASGAAPAIWRSTRTNPGSPFGAPARVAAATGFVEAPALSADGRLMYFHKLVEGVFVLQCAQR